MNSRETVEPIVTTFSSNSPLSKYKWNEIDEVKLSNDKKV
jgi:hypothetical protein